MYTLTEDQKDCRMKHCTRHEKSEDRLHIKYCDSGETWCFHKVLELAMEESRISKTKKCAHAEEPNQDCWVFLIPKEYQ